jgi:hypothetical protein
MARTAPLVSVPAPPRAVRSSALLGRRAAARGSSARLPRFPAHQRASEERPAMHEAAPRRGGDGPQLEPVGAATGPPMASAQAARPARGSPLLESRGEGPRQCGCGPGDLRAPPRRPPLPTRRAFRPLHSPTPDARPAERGPDERGGHSRPRARAGTPGATQAAPGWHGPRTSHPHAPRARRAKARRPTDRRGLPRCIHRRPAGSAQGPRSPNPTRLSPQSPRPEPLLHQPLLAPARRDLAACQRLAVPFQRDGACVAAGSSPAHAAHPPRVQPLAAPWPARNQGPALNEPRRPRPPVPLRAPRHTVSPSRCAPDRCPPQAPARRPARAAPPRNQTNAPGRVSARHAARLGRRPTLAAPRTRRPPGARTDRPLGVRPGGVWSFVLALRLSRSLRLLTASRPRRPTNFSTAVRRP